MKTGVLAAALAASIAWAGPALADMPGTDWMPADQVIQSLRANGYTVISSIEADDGRWEGDGMKNGVKTSFHADPRTGAILYEKRD